MPQITCWNKFVANARSKMSFLIISKLVTNHFCFYIANGVKRYKIWYEILNSKNFGSPKGFRLIFFVQFELNYNIKKTYPFLDSPNDIYPSNLKHQTTSTHPKIDNVFVDHHVLNTPDESLSLGSCPQTTQLLKSGPEVRPSHCHTARQIQPCVRSLKENTWLDWRKIF